MSEATEMSPEALEQYIRGELEYPLTIAGLQSAAKRLIRERDDARAEIAYLKNKEKVMAAVNDKAEQLSYERGVREAAKVAEPYEFTAKTILALLEKPPSVG
jgi:hypothetical protein